VIPVFVLFREKNDELSVEFGGCI